ncbi:hypothetical protein AAU61_13235 [Desulfocarbo indianensis]|nr:hypothetical protein AAU61_13235 [Desulfocarbo indianensis]
MTQALRGGAGASQAADSNREGVYENLGDALHVAQDRGAHGEGARGEGHDQDRYNPDNPTENPGGYQEAENNTRGVMTRARDILMVILGRPRASAP